ncbi:MAG: NrfD/PsrC family molybdoenzyme membrane anchor subunit [Candidatus Methylomirabilales bacterium]
MTGARGLSEMKFIMDLQPQQHWDWKVAFYLFGAGTSAGLIFLEVVLQGLGVLDEATALWGMWTGLALVLVSLGLLFSHLGPGARWGFLYVFRRPGTSWIARGAIIVTVLVFLRILVLLPSVPGLEGLPWGQGTLSGMILRGAVLLFAAAFMAYSGLVLSSWNSIAFWNTPLLPILYVGYSFLGGMAILPIIEVITRGRGGMETVGAVLWPSLLLLLLGNGFVLILYISGMSTGTVPARESVRRLLRGPYCRSFWGGTVGIGLVVPTIIVASASGGRLGADTVSVLALVLACVAILVGGFVLRNNVLRVGVYGYPV